MSTQSTPSHKYESGSSSTDLVMASGSFHPDDRTSQATATSSTTQTRSLASLRIPPTLTREASGGSESDFPRSTSATSSLDPYYFTVPSRSESPAPPLPMDGNERETRIPSKPLTPASDPASIDRNNLVGVGELRTPRWPRVPSSEESLSRISHEIHETAKHEESHVDALDDDNDRDSPWTIEAVDGELDDIEQLLESAPREQVIPPRTLSGPPDESGGEEILYPRKPQKLDVVKDPSLDEVKLEEPVQSSPPAPKSPPSSFPSPVRKARKRSSDEFVLDHSEFLSSKLAPKNDNELTSESHQEKVLLQRHQSISLVPKPAAPVRDKRRGGSVRISMVSTTSSSVNNAKGAKHSRQQSASSVSSTFGEGHRRGLSVTDAKPVTASATSVNQPRRVSGPTTKPSSEKLSLSKERDIHSSSSVAHSLLRGTQEGWSALDDDATAEALRKLDGLASKGPRSRGSIRATSRASNNSRPSTPASRGHRSEGTDGSERLSRINSIGSHRAKEKLRPESKVILENEGQTLGAETELFKASAESAMIKPSEDSVGMLEVESKKHVPGVRSSYLQKRGSTSSTTFTGTPTSGSRESGNLSASTSVTSASVASHRLSLIRTKRNSAGSDISSIHSEVPSHRDRAPLLAVGDPADGASVPPVPPLPKDLSSYKTPPQSSTSLVFPVTDSMPDSGKDHDKEANGCSQLLEEPRSIRASDSSSGKPEVVSHNAREISAPAPVLPKTPSKKWSFTNALNIRHSASPGRREASALKSPSERQARSGKDKHLRPSSSKESGLLPVISPKSSVEAWQSIQRGAMASETSLVSLTSLSSLPEPSPPISPLHHSEPSAQRDDERPSPCPSGTASSLSTAPASHFDTQLSQGSPISKSSSRELVNKRSTPSSIPFFRRVSSHSMQVPQSSSTAGVRSSPTSSSAPNAHHSGLKSDKANARERPLTSPMTPGASHRKSSMLSLGLPSILKGSSSRKSLQVDRGILSSHDMDKARRQKDSDTEQMKSRKDDKDRSESRISVLMGRKRGKTLSSTDQKKIKPITLPPMQVSALPPATAERIAHVKPYGSSSSSNAHGTTTSRLTSQTISSMRKQSDSSLRSTRQQLPTIAGSPSVSSQGTVNGQNYSGSYKEQGCVSQNTPLSGSMVSIPKETPTRIPRIASRSSTVGSPVMKHSTSHLGSKRTSQNVGSAGLRSEATEDSLNEFGVLDNLVDPPKSQIPSATQRQFFRSSSPAGARSVRQSTQSTLHAAASPTSTTTPRKSTHDSFTIKGLRKSSTGSVTLAAATATADQQLGVASKLSPSKGLNKLLSPKVSLPGSRLSGSSTTPNLFRQQSNASPTSRRQSFSTPSPVPSSVDEDEILGDEEMMQYIKRTQARKMAHGAKKEELDEMLKFPEPFPPTRPSSPASILNSERTAQLSDFERKEILDYASVYYIGNRNEKKLASRDVSANNYGYDDDQGDYLVINHDHLVYRYEIVNTLGKGSFGQVLQCKDHCTGESVAIKIIRNKKRFHHQALVEIKILENLRKWDPEERHHVIKMTDHFYFRNHLCIAMELLSINLYELIKANGFAGFSTTLIRRFTSQMLLSLTLMRHHRIVHCDLKPEILPKNVLLRHPAKSGIKVIDFGSSCLEHEKVYTYIQSRFYRSPEVILGMSYNMAIDMWSLGCILAELYTGYPIFPGENEQEQLACIMEVLGVPDKELINRSSRKRLFFDSTGAPRPVVNSKGRRRRAGSKTLAQVLRCDDELFVDFVCKCLAWDPERRMKPQSALRHPFVTAGRKAKIINNPIPNSPRSHLTPSSSLLPSSRNKPTETPKKSQISAPTPLTARTSRTLAMQSSSTPLNSSLTHSAQSTSKTFRSLHAHYHSSRTANGLAIATAK